MVSKSVCRARRPFEKTQPRAGPETPPNPIRARSREKSNFDRPKIRNLKPVRKVHPVKTSHPHKHASEFAVNYGVTDALAPFPLHSLVTTMTTAINNNANSQNTADALPILLRVVDPEEFARYDCVTPAALDYLADCKDRVQRMA